MKRSISKKIISISVIWRILCLALLTSSCRYFPSQEGPDKITHINIIDRNGLSETISSKERLASFQKTDFLTNQPYQKVMRIYGRDSNADAHSCITSYHPNGQIKQYLEAVNGRAKGAYRQWHPNGQLKVDAYVIGGTADISTQAEESFLFDGITKAWDEEGNVIATIPYQKGNLHGTSSYFHKNGTIWKLIPFNDGLIDGVLEIYLENGSIFAKTAYQKGVKEGVSYRYWDDGTLAYKENYQKDKLMSAKYYDFDGGLVSEIKDGNGKRAIFGYRHLKKLLTYKEGAQEGSVEIFDENKQLICAYSVKNGEKEGEENIFFTNGKPKLSLSWKEGALQGPVKTWYENGQIETHKEMSQNKKHGLFTTWYPEGTLMFVEEYEDDTLIKGKYYSKTDNAPLSVIDQGCGIATLFDREGNPLRKISYHEGKPQS